MKNNQIIKLTTLIYLLPIFIFAAYITRDFPNTIISAIILAGLFTCTVMILAGTILNLKKSDDSIKTYIELLALFTSILLIIEIISGIIFIASGETSQIINLTMLTVWLTLIYTILIAAPVTSLVVQKLSANFRRSKEIKFSSIAFSVFGFVLFVIYSFVVIFREANDVIRTAIPHCFSTLFMNVGFTIWIILGIVTYFLIISGREKQV